MISELACTLQHDLLLMIQKKIHFWPGPFVMCKQKREKKDQINRTRNSAPWIAERISASVEFPLDAALIALGSRGYRSVKDIQAREAEMMDVLDK